MLTRNYPKQLETTTLPSLSNVIEATIEPYREEYRRIVNGWLAEGTFGITYPALLVETYHYVKHSCSLMNRACSELQPTHGALQCYLAKHISEEVGHENWALADLEYLGYDREHVVKSPPLPETINLIGSQQYVINYMHPAGLLGYVYVMESQAPSETSIAFLRDIYQISPKAMSFLIGHGEADIEHKEELRLALDTHFTDQREREAALISAVLGLSNVNRLLARIRLGNYDTWLPTYL